MRLDGLRPMSKRVQADRVLATGETLNRKDLTAVPSNVRELSVYTSDRSGLQKKAQKQAQESIPKESPYRKSNSLNASITASA